MEYRKAVEELGMDEAFCRAIGNEDDYWLVSSQHLWHWISERIEAAAAVIA